MPKPNIVYLHSHDTGRYVQPYGHAVPTPNLQRLAEEGVLFRQAFCAAPTCSASRAALVTGQSPHSCGMIGLAHRGFPLNDYGKHIVHTLREAGYRSTLVGAQHVAQGTHKIGYDEIVKVEHTRAEALGPAAADFLKGGPRHPFFVSIGCSDTHRKFREPGPAEDARYCLPPSPLPDTPETRRDMAAFKASARMWDGAVGEVLGAIDEAGLAGNTLVVCTTDHGIAFPRMKCNLHDSGIGVMLIMRGPGGFTGGKVVDAMVSHVDIFPTLCEIAGAQPPAWLQGRSMMPLVASAEGERRDEINEETFSEVTYHAAYEPMRAVRTRRWKYIKRFGGRTKPVLPNCDDSPSKQVWLDHGWGERELPEEELYDLVFDPNETSNIVGDPSAAETLSDMRARLDRWMKATDDPLLEGPVPAPKDAKVNDPDGLSPNEPTTTAERIHASRDLHAERADGRVRRPRTP